MQRAKRKEITTDTLRKSGNPLFFYSRFVTDQRNAPKIAAMPATRKMWPPKKLP
jgi:hypothetical protein